MGISLDELVSVGIVDSGGDELNINADGSLNVTISGQSNVYAEDSAHVSGDDGNFILALRQDTKASSAGTDGDYAALIQNSLGELYVVDEAGNALLGTIDADTSSIALSATAIEAGMQSEDTASAGGESLMMVGGYRQDADTSPVSADGDFHGFIFDNVGNLKVRASVSIEPSDAEYAEDSAHTTGDVGLHMLSVRQDVLASSVSADGDYASFKINTLGRLYTTDSKNNSGQVKLVVAGLAAVQLDATPLANREEVTIQNEGTKDIYLGFDNTVTTTGATSGLKISKNSSATFKWGDAIELWVISGTAAQDVILAEVA